MAWDHSAGRLNGIYDFGDARIAGAHLELVAVSLVGADLAAGVAAAYGRRTGHVVDLNRMAVLAAAWRLRELAEEADDPHPFTVRQAMEWVSRGARALDDQP